MRTAIFLVGLIISEALGYSPTDSVSRFYAIMFSIFAGMDIVDFVRRKR